MSLRSLGLGNGYRKQLENYDRVTITILAKSIELHENTVKGPYSAFQNCKVKKNIEKVRKIQKLWRTVEQGSFWATLSKMNEKS